jgi:hypothetical protein
MASTYSTLKIELIGTGEQSGTWGTTTNTNLGTAIEEAIVGSADVSFSSADVTLTLTDTNAAQSARNLRLNLTGTSGGARNLILGSGCQIEKPYLINNGLTDTVTVKNTTGTGIAVPAGKTMWVYNNGTNVVDAVTHLTSLTLGSALPIASGGTGTTSTTFVNLTTNVTGTLPIANGGTGSTSTTFVNLATNVTGDLPFANLTQGSALSVLGVTGNATADNASIAAGTDHQVLRRSGTAVAFGAVNLAQAAAITGTLPVGNGGTGITSFGTGVATWLGTPSSANLAAAVTDETGSGALVFATTPVITGLREKSAAVSASDIDLSAGNYFTKTISGNTTFTVSNVATSGDVAAFVLVLTNGGSATVTYFSGVTFAGGTAPTLTASGVDLLAFFTINGGTTWRGLVLAYDIKAP